MINSDLQPNCSSSIAEVRAPMMTVPALTLFDFSSTNDRTRGFELVGD